MIVILTLLMLGCMISILIGLFKPTSVIRWGAPEKRGRGKVILFYGLAVIVLAIFIGLVSPESDNPQTLAMKDHSSEGPTNGGQEASQSTIVNSHKEESTPKDKTRAELEKEKEKEKEKSKEEVEKLKHPKWNMNEPDATKNGNINIAIEMLKASKEIPVGELVSPEEVIKTPWNFYGKPLIFSGEVAVVEDYPPGSDFGKAGLASDIVIESNDGTIVEFFSMVPSGNIKVGQTVSITAYPVGRAEVENKLGGSFTHLVVVTNQLNALEGEEAL
ncbi:hypothetical protein ACM1RC_16160 [Paenibacillus azoreducens]|uniref:hypothetical protein n=1 Tax=Paenibacillus azoreducens TaxID=116718 RepID=UPI0039F4DBAD